MGGLFVIKAFLFSGKLKWNDDLNGKIIRLASP